MLHLWWHHVRGIAVVTIVGAEMAAVMLQPYTLNFLGRIVAIELADRR
jgi:hypothetical protein